MSGPGVIAPEPLNRCQLCNKVDYTRPYGPKGEEVCFDCAMKDEKAAKRQFEKHVFGKGLPRTVDLSARESEEES